METSFGPNRSSTDDAKTQEKTTPPKLKTMSTHEIEQRGKRPEGTRQSVLGRHVLVVVYFGVDGGNLVLQGSSALHKTNSVCLGDHRW